MVLDAQPILHRSDPRWWIGDGLSRVPTIALLMWVHERRRLHRVPAATCPTCVEYRDVYDGPPRDGDVSSASIWLTRRHRQRGMEHIRRRLRQLDDVVIGADLYWEILERDDFRCRSCGARRFLVVDHVWPVSRGGTNDPSNLQTVCRSCTHRKSGRV